MLFLRRFLPRAASSAVSFRDPRPLNCCTQTRFRHAPFSPTSNAVGAASYTTHATQESFSLPSDQFRSNPDKSSKPGSAAAKKGRGDIELYDAIVYDGMPVYKIRQRIGEVCVQKNGTPANLKLDESLTERLEKCHDESDAIGALKILEQIRDEGLAPTASAFLRVIEICARSANFHLAEDVLEHFQPLHGVYENPDAVQCAARATIALSYLGKDRPKDALHVLGFFDNVREKSLEARLNAMNLGQDELAWGCLIRALTAAQLPDQAVAIGREAMQRGVVMSDSLIFFLLEALRAMSRWKEADVFFQSSIDSGIVPHERTVGSLLRTLTAPGTRRFVERERIIELTRLPKEPSSRFRVVSLVALASIGEVEEAQKVFDSLAKESHPEPADERAFSILIGSYASYLEKGVPDHVRDGEIQDWYTRFSASIDEVWRKYMVCYGNVPPSKQAKEARSRAFQRYLWSKSRCMCCEDATSALEAALNDRAMKKWLNIGQPHFAAVLTGIEITCDTVALERVLKLMEKEGIRHDHRSLAFAIGSMLGQGDTLGAVKLVQCNMPSLVTAYALENQRNYRVKLLLRRLKMLLHSVRDVDVEGSSAREVAGVCRLLETHLKKEPRKEGNWR